MTHFGIAWQQSSVVQIRLCGSHGGTRMSNRTGRAKPGGWYPGQNQLLLSLLTNIPPCHEACGSIKKGDCRAYRVQYAGPNVKSCPSFACGGRCPFARNWPTDGKCAQADWRQGSIGCVWIREIRRNQSSRRDKCKLEGERPGVQCGSIISSCAIVLENSWQWRHYSRNIASYP